MLPFPKSFLLILPSIEKNGKRKSVKNLRIVETSYWGEIVFNEKVGKITTTCLFLRKPGRMLPMTTVLLIGLYLVTRGRLIS